MEAQSLNHWTSREVPFFPLSFLHLLTSFFLFAALQGMQDLSSLTRDQTCAPCSGSVESQPLNHQGNPFFLPTCSLLLRLEVLVLATSNHPRDFKNADAQA